MSKIHVLETDHREAKVVLHTDTPAGNNSVGISWKEAGLNSGRLGTTVLTEGTGAGQIATAEKTQVESGDVIEIADTIHVESGGATSASIDEMADQLIDKHEADLQIILNYYGYTAG